MRMIRVLTLGLGPYLVGLLSTTGVARAADIRGLPGCKIEGKAAHSSEVDQLREVFFRYRAQFEDEKALIKPTEPQLQQLTDRLEAQTEKLVDSTPAREKSDTWVMYGRFLGLLTNYYRSGLPKVNYGKISFHALQEAVFADPSNTDAWEAYSRLVLNLGRMNSISRFFTEKTLGLNFRSDREIVLDCLRKGSSQGGADGEMLLKDVTMIEGS